jgi:cell wall-associated NlpC family hydrolase
MKCNALTKRIFYASDNLTHLLWLITLAKLGYYYQVIKKMKTSINKMKCFIFYITFVTSLALPSIAIGNFTTKNVEEVTMIFLENGNEANTKNSLSQDVLIQAMSLEGSRYKFGGNSPETGFDCSGFVNYVFNQAAKLELPRTTGGLSRIGQSVAPNELQAGDLVFFNTRRSAFSHVGIYIGDGDFIHAPRPGKAVMIENMTSGYWQQHFNGAKRVDEIAAH